MRYSLLICLFLVSIVSEAQEDDTIRFIQGLPEAGTDSSLYDDAGFDNPPPHFRKVTINDIPAELVNELENNELFSGWRRRIIWQDQKSGLYWIHFADDSVVRSYGFTEEGNTVSVKEKSKADMESESP